MGKLNSRENATREGDKIMEKLNLEQIKNYWAYQDVSKNYKINIKETKDGARVTISDKYGVEAMFKVKRYSYNLDTMTVEGYSVYDRADNITEELDYSENINDCVKGCIYYFSTRY
jgi:hypothetical protein